MNNDKIDIDLIAKYHNGELDGKAMQALEERALEDPFLAEAMDGFSDFSIQQNDIIDLNERLKDRVRLRADKRIGGSFGFRNWYLAASSIILIGFISIYFNLPDENFSLNEAQKTTNLKPAEKDVVGAALPEDTVSEKETIIEESPIIVSLAKPDYDSSEVMAASDQVILEPAIASAFALDSGKRENVIASYSRKSVDDFASNGLKTTSRSAMSVALQNNFVKGKVADLADESPLTGVSVLDVATGISTTTDQNGDFKIMADPNSKLSFQNLGYEKKESELGNPSDSLKVYLKKDNASLSEVAVIGYGTSRNQSAGPKEGWAAFKKYLAENSELETNETGTVVVEFVINSNGGLTDFKILKGLSKLANARAIYLIRNYSSWKGASDGTASKAKVTLRFR